MKILITGFEPFGGETVNPSEECLKGLPDQIRDAEILKLSVPVVWRRSLAVIEDHIRMQDPDVILSLGQAGGRRGITVERVGINLDDFRIPDNEGNLICDRPVFEDGPDAYLTNLPVKEMVRAIRERGIEASVSDTAGTFICNHVLYGIRYLCERKYPGKRNGFIHLPYVPEQAVGKKEVPVMPLSEMIEGITAILEAMAGNTRIFSSGCSGPM